MPSPKYNNPRTTSQVPVPTVLVGSGPRFMMGMTTFSRALPKIFRRLNQLGLQQAYRGLEKLRFVEFPEVGGDPFYYDKQKDIISVYPMVSTAQGRLDKVVYAAFGARHFHHNISSAGKTQWTKKLVYPDRSVIDRLQDMFRDRARPQYKSYIRDFRTATEKLVVIHLLNALIANSVAPQRVSTIDLSSFPPTADFVNGRAPFSMRPLISAYAGKRWGLDKYDNAFAEYCARRGHLDIAEPSVEDATLSLFQAVTFNG